MRQANKDIEKVRKEMTGIVLSSIDDNISPYYKLHHYNKLHYSLIICNKLQLHDYKLYQIDIKYTLFFFMFCVTNKETEQGSGEGFTSYT